MVIYIFLESWQGIQKSSAQNVFFSIIRFQVEHFGRWYNRQQSNVVGLVIWMTKVPPEHTTFRPWRWEDHSQPGPSAPSAVSSAQTLPTSSATAFGAVFGRPVYRRMCIKSFGILQRTQQKCEVFKLFANVFMEFLSWVPKLKETGPTQTDYHWWGCVMMLMIPFYGNRL